MSCPPDHDFSTGSMILIVPAGYIRSESCGCSTLVTSDERRTWICRGHGPGDPLGEVSPPPVPYAVPRCPCGHEHH